MNLDKENVAGWELAFQNQFESLPQPFDGLGVIARLTRASSNSRASIHQLRGIEGLSDFYNLSLFYEKDHSIPASLISIVASLSGDKAVRSVSQKWLSLMVS